MYMDCYLHALWRLPPLFPSRRTAFRESQPPIEIRSPKSDSTCFIAWTRTRVIRQLPTNWPQYNSKKPLPHQIYESIEWAILIGTWMVTVSGQFSICETWLPLAGRWLVSLEGFDDPMIEDAGFTDQEGDWSRRGSRIVLDDEHEDEDRMTIQNEKIVHKSFFNGMDGSANLLPIIASMLVVIEPSISIHSLNSRLTFLFIALRFSGRLWWQRYRIRRGEAPIEMYIHYISKVSIIQIIQISLSANVIVIVVTKCHIIDVFHLHIKANDDERHLRLRKKNYLNLEDLVLRVSGGFWQMANDWCSWRCLKL